MIAFLDRQIIALLVTPIKADLGISDMQIGLLQGFAFALLYAFCAIPIGYAVDRHSRRLIIFMGVLIWAVATCASGLVDGFSQLFITRIFVGMGEAALGPAAYSMIGDLFERKRLSFALSVYSIGSALGSASALILGGFLVVWVGDGLQLPFFGALRPWQSVLFLAGIPGLICCTLIFAVPEPSRTHAGSQNEGLEGSSWRALFGLMRLNRRFYTSHFGAFACLMATAYAMMTWLPSALQRSYGWSIPDIGLSLGIAFAIANVGGLLFNGLAADALFTRGRTDAPLCYYFYASAVIAVFGLAAPLIAWSGIAYLVIMAPALALNSIAGVAAAALQIVTPPQLRGKVSAFYPMITSLCGLIFGPASVALVADYIVGPARIDLAIGIVLACVCPLAMICFAVGMPAMRKILTRELNDSVDVLNSSQSEH